MTRAQRHKIILDVDTGTGIPVRDIDDGLAIALALASPEVELLGCTTCAGNCFTSESTRNTLRILEIAGRGDVPVAEGRAHPLLVDRSTSDALLAERTRRFRHYWDDLPRLPEPTLSPSRLPAHEFIIEQAKAHPGEVVIVKEGSLTNLALALLVAPEIAPLLKAVFHMGGDCIGAAWSADHDWGGEAASWQSALRLNDRFDPHATAVVVRSGIPFTFVTNSLCARVRLRPPDVDRIAAGGSEFHTFLAETTRPWVRIHLDRWGLDGATMWDPLTLAAVFLPELFSFVPMRCDVDRLLAEEADYLHPSPDTPQVSVTLDVEAQRFESVLVERLSGPLYS